MARLPGIRGWYLIARLNHDHRTQTHSSESCSLGEPGNGLRHGPRLIPRDCDPVGRDSPDGPCGISGDGDYEPVSKHGNRHTGVLI